MQNKKNDKYDKKIELNFKVQNSSRQVNTMLVVKSPAVIQTVAITAPKIFSLTRRCLNGRNVACVRSREIAARFNNDAKAKKKSKAMPANTKNLIQDWKMIVQKPELLPKYNKKLSKGHQQTYRQLPG